MDDDYTHPLLAQVPLTVSPFVTLPTATTLPYTYKSLPTSLPRSFTEPPQQQPATPDPQAGGTPKPKFVVSSSGHVAHPDDILASCHALQAHLTKLRDDAKANLDKWEASIRDRELAEKRRIAPGWLDSDDKMLQPVRVVDSESAAGGSAQSLMDEQDEGRPGAGFVPAQDSTGEQLDRAFGGLSLQPNQQLQGLPSPTGPQPK